MKNVDLGEAVINGIVKASEGRVKDLMEALKKDADKRPPQKFQIGETVKVNTWTSPCEAVITGCKWIFHYRLEQWCWGYSIDRRCALAFMFIPEGYIEKITG